MKDAYECIQISKQCNRSACRTPNLGSEFNKKDVHAIIIKIASSGLAARRVSCAPVGWIISTGACARVESAAGWQYHDRHRSLPTARTHRRRRPDHAARRPRRHKLPACSHRISANSALRPRAAPAADVAAASLNAFSRIESARPDRAGLEAFEASHSSRTCRARGHPER